MRFFKKIFSKENKEQLDEGLQKTKEGVWSKITHAVAGRSTIDDDLLDDLEGALIDSDLGTDTVIKIIEKLQDRVKRDKYVNTSELNSILCEEITSMLAAPETASEGLADFELPQRDEPYVILVVGVNGAGKTTTIGKLAYKFTQKGYKVVLGAADTYRAAAIEQLDVWKDRANVDIVKQNMGSDPAAVAFDALSHAKAVGADVVIIDTAGRLHNKKGLMDELTKVKKVMKKVIADAPNEVLLVLDGTVGQNAFEQVRGFMEATDVNCLAITKLDGTAKGGVVIGISDQFKIPVKYIGLGEQIDNIQVFNPEEFVKSLFGDSIRK